MCNFGGFIMKKKAMVIASAFLVLLTLAALKKEIAKAEAVQKKTIYKLSSSYRRDYLDYALSNAQKALSGNKGEVTFAKWLHDDHLLQAGRWHLAQKIQ